MEDPFEDIFLPTYFVNVYKYGLCFAGLSKYNS